VCTEFKDVIESFFQSPFGDLARMMNNKSAMVSCKFHPNAPLIEDYRAGDQICSECGLVVGDRVIDVGSEWRTFSSDNGAEDKSRVGAAENTLLGSSDLIHHDRAHDGGGPGGATQYTNRRSGGGGGSSSDRTLINAFRSIGNMADRINLTKTIVDRANNLFKMVHDGRNLKGRANDAISAAVLYIACR
jgi:transcription initiation factor TFIIB